MTIDEWFGSKPSKYHTPTKWERIIWESAQAEILKDQEPNLGLATTFELLDELRARAEIHGWGNYRTVDMDKDGPQDIHSPEAWEKVP